MSATSADISRAEISPPQLSCYDVPTAGSFAHAHAPIRDTTVLPLSASARVAPVEEGEGSVDIPPPRVDPAPLVTEPYRSIDASHNIQAWRQAYVHAQPWQSEDTPQVTIHSWGMSHARPWEESSELVVHTTYATPTAAGTAFFTRDTVARDLVTLVPSVRPSVLPQVTETDIRPTARLVDRPEFVQRSRSRTPDRAPRSPRLRRPLDIATSSYPVYTARAQSPPLAPPPSPMPGMSQYLGSDNESLSTDSTPPPAQREPLPQYVSRRTSVVSSHRSRSTAEMHADAMGLARQLAGSLQEQLQQQRTDATAREARQAAEARQLQEEAKARELRIAEEVRKAQEAAYSMEMERTRQLDRREDRLFDQFRDCIEKTRSDLNEAALLRERAARLELELQHAREAAAAAAAERTQPIEVQPPTVSEYFVSNPKATLGTQPPISRKLAKKMRHFFASAITESDVEQDSTATAAGTAGTAGTTGITGTQVVQPPLIELEPVATVAPPVATHVYEPVDVIDVDEPVWILHSTAESTATTPTQSTSYISHSSVLPRTALSATQAKGTPPTAHTTATLPMQSQYLHLPPPTQTVVADIHPPPISFADTLASISTHALAAHVPASFPLVELLPPVPIRVVEIPQPTPVLTAGTVVPLPSASPYPAHYHPPLAPVAHTVPPPAHSHHTHSYSNVPVPTTATTTTTSSVSQPQMYYNVGESIVEQVLRSPTSIVSTSQPAAAESSVLPTVTSTAKQEPAVATAAPVSSSIITAAPSAAASASVAPLATPQAPVVFKQLQQPRTYNGSTSWKDYRAHFERVCKVNGWTTPQDKAQNLTLFLEGVAADVLKDIDESAPTAYEDIWVQLSRRFGYTDAPRDAMRRFDSCRQQDNESLQEFEQALRLLHREAWPAKTQEQRDSELKRRFEDGLSNHDMAQHLRLHARDCDFAATVLKARQFADAAESTRPKKSVRIIAKPTNEIEADGDNVVENPAYFQPLIDGMRDVMREYFPPARSRVNQLTRGQSPNSQPRDPTPPGSRVPSPAPSEERSYAACLTQGNRQSRPMDRGNRGLLRPQVNGRFQSPARGFQSPGPRPQSPGPRPQSPGPRYQDQGQRFQSPARPRPQSPALYARRDDFPRPRTPSNGPTDYRQSGYQGRRFQSPGPRYDRPPPPRVDRDMTPRQSYPSRDQPPRQTTPPPPPRSPMAQRRNDGCYVCGRFGCHSDFHIDQRPPTPRYDHAPTHSPRSTNPFQYDRVEEYIPPVPPRQGNLGNGPRAPMSGDRSPIRRQ